ncbi:hypothetical protein [Streptomyces sp. NPDC002133]|uniref:hypothetical protein n=1 Tax=Streptomyces sp. NPDC002133 TaxID=3154409 RepID=UPI00331D5983
MWETLVGRGCALLLAYGSAYANSGPDSPRTVRLLGARGARCQSTLSSSTS